MNKEVAITITLKEYEELLIIKKKYERIYNENCKLREEHNITDISLLDENQELKQKYLNAVADYETTMFEKEQLNSLVNSCQEEIRQLKKQLEEKNKPQIFIDTQDMEERYAEGLYQDYLEEENKKYKNQQKEFVKWLESMLDNDIDIFSVVRVKDVLSKYKEIIGNDINVGSKGVEDENIKIEK